MIDSLDKQILEIIDKAPSIVRSITEREIESGVLFPSVSTMDIKRNLPYDVGVEVIEGRLNVLEREGYIYFERRRWWLTNKGREVLGRSGEKWVLPTLPSRPMRKILEETFSRFEGSRMKPEPRGLRGGINELINKKRRADALLLELRKGFEAGLITEEEHSRTVEILRQKLGELSSQIESFVRNRRSKLLREITALEESLAKKRAELEELNRVRPVD